MFVPYDYANLATLVTELRIIVEEARARGDLAVPNDGFVPDYWYGVASGYQDAIERIEALLGEDQNRIS